MAFSPSFPSSSSSSSSSFSTTSTTSAAAASSSSLLDPSSCSLVHSTPLLGYTNLPSSSSWSPSYRPSSLARDHLESLIARHGRPTRFSLSSLEELTATASTYTPPSPLSPPHSSVVKFSDPFAYHTSYRSKSRPIPIPKSFPNSLDDDLPVTPLTGRFERDYFPHRDLCTPTNSSRHGRGSNHRHSSSRMRSDSSTFYASVVPQPMSSSGRSDPPQAPRSRGQNAPKSSPAFHLGSLPRFHPAVYQSSGSAQAINARPPSPCHARQQVYRASSSSRDPMLQYRELVEGVVLQKVPSRPLSPSPAAPRLDPLRSPGPVTPLALEDAGGYLTAGSSLSAGDLQHSAPAPDLLERLIARENERIRQKPRKNPKGW